MLGFWFFGCMYVMDFGGEKKFDFLARSLGFELVTNFWVLCCGKSHCRY